MKLTIDTRETQRVESATRFYKRQGLTVETKELLTGDFLFTDETNSVVFEFKLIPDFINSIQTGRVFNQAISQAEEYDHHYVIIFGNLHTRTKSIAESRDYREVTIQQYLAAIASLNRYTTVIETYNGVIDEAYYRMLVQAEKCLKNKPIVKRFPKKHKNSALNWLCHDVHGVNYKTASKIVNELEISTLEDLFTLEHHRLTQIDGIGDKIANRIMQSIENES